MQRDYNCRPWATFRARYMNVCLLASQTSQTSQLVTCTCASFLLSAHSLVFVACLSQHALCRFVGVSRTTCSLIDKQPNYTTVLLNDICVIMLSLSTLSRTRYIGNPG